MFFSNLTPVFFCFPLHVLLCQVVSKIWDLVDLLVYFPLKLPFHQDLLQWHGFSIPILVLVFWWHGKCPAILCCQRIFDRGYPHTPAFKTTLLKRCLLHSVVSLWSLMLWKGLRSILRWSILILEFFNHMYHQSKAFNTLKAFYLFLQLYGPFSG